MSIQDVEDLARKYYPRSIDYRDIVREIGINPSSAQISIRKIWEKPARCPKVEIYTVPMPPPIKRIRKVRFKKEYLNTTYTFKCEPPDPKRYNTKIKANWYELITCPE